MSEFVSDESNDVVDFDEAYAKLKAINSRIGKLEAQQTKILQNQTKILQVLNQILTRNGYTNTVDELANCPLEEVIIENDVQFPLKSVEEVEIMEKYMAANFQKYEQLVRFIVQPRGITKTFDKLLEPEIIIQYNYDGSRNKKSFKELKCFNEILYNVLCKDDYTKANYETDMRHAFKRQKNKYYKAVFVSKAKRIKHEPICDINENPFDDDDDDDEKKLNY